MAVVIDHSGKAVLVTGAGAGIGREVARWFARAGASVVVNDIRADAAADVAREIEDAGGTAAAIAADCRDDAQVEALVAGTVARFARLDVAVNNVGMLPSGRSVGAFVDLDAAYWHDVLEQNLVASARCARAEAHVMLGQGAGGVILFVSSGETTRPSPYNAAYAAAKAAIN